MRGPVLLLLLASLLGCSSTLATPPADSGAQTDAPAIVDVPIAPDVPAASDLPTVIDRPAVVDVPAPIDTPADRPIVDAPDAPCASPLLFCGGACVDRQTDRSNCGACGVTCPAGVMCTNGMCSPCGCGIGLSCCDNTCVDLGADPRHCGSCGTVCAAGESCVAGACTLPGFMVLAPCGAAADYTTGSTVRFGGSAGNTYSPRCLTVRVGDTVTWEGTFSAHPLVPSTRGSASNPIARVATGTSAPVRFTRAGFYPFFCDFHGTDTGGGMAGVVRVIE